MKPPTARKLAVRHTTFMCLTATFLATGGFEVLIISKCMHGLQSCLFTYITIVAFPIYAKCGEDGAKKGGWRLCIK